MFGLRDAPRLETRSRGRDNHFNLIRMFAASGVLVSHAYPIAWGPGAVQPLSRWLDMTLGTVCVYIFFAISGFFIAKSFDRGQSRTRFLEARALRLFPALITVLVLTVLVAGLFLTTAPPGVYWADVPGYLIRNLTLASLDYDLPGVFETVPYGPPINGSLWTLFYEVVCYAGVFLAGMLGLLRKPRLFAGAFALVVLACIATPYLPVHSKLASLANLALPFAIGTAMYVWRAHIPMHWSVTLGLTLLAALTHGSAAFAPLFVLALSYGVLWLGLVRMPALLAYNRLGDYSYGIYIYAFPLQQLAASMGAVTPFSNMAIAFPATLICAVLSWHLVEKPALGLVRPSRPADPALKKVKS